MKFKSEKEAIEWVRSNMPLAVHPLRKAKTVYVGTFKSYNAFLICCEVIGKEIFKLQNE